MWRPTGTHPHHSTRGALRPSPEVIEADGRMSGDAEALVCRRVGDPVVETLENQPEPGLVGSRTVEERHAGAHLHRVERTEDLVGAPTFDGEKDPDALPEPRAQDRVSQVG